MSFKHKNFPIYGLQYHPESIETKVGNTILDNFLKYYEPKFYSEINSKNLNLAINYLFNTENISHQAIIINELTKKYNQKKF